MSNITIPTVHFGLYTEEKDTNNLPVEITGKVRVSIYRDTPLAYLYSEDGLRRRYDLPKFMTKYANKRVAVLARVYTKQVAAKLYYKLVVISAKPLSSKDAREKL